MKRHTDPLEDMPYKLFRKDNSPERSVDEEDMYDDSVSVSSQTSSQYPGSPVEIHFFPITPTPDEEEKISRGLIVANSLGTECQMCGQNYSEYVSTERPSTPCLCGKNSCEDCIERRLPRELRSDVGRHCDSCMGNYCLACGWRECQSCEEDKEEEVLHCIACTELTECSKCEGFSCNEEPCCNCGYDVCNRCSYKCGACNYLDKTNIRVHIDCAVLCGACLAFSCKERSCEMVLGETPGTATIGNVCGIICCVGAFYNCGKCGRKCHEFVKECNVCGKDLCALHFPCPTCIPKAKYTNVLTDCTIKFIDYS